MTRSTSGTGYDDHVMEDATVLEGEEVDVHMTKEDLEKEEEVIRELERKKRALEERVTGMERDLGGLNR